MRSPKVLALLGSIALMLAFFTTASTALAATSPGSSMSDATYLVGLQKQCDVVRVQLHGLDHTFTCLRHHTNATVTPNIGRDNGCDPNYDTFVVKNYGDRYVCFSGYGYMGVALYQVNSVKNTGSSGAWFRYYPGAHTAILLAGRIRNFTTSGIEVTQLCYGNANPPNC